MRRNKNHKNLWIYIGSSHEKCCVHNSSGRTTRKNSWRLLHRMGWDVEIPFNLKWKGEVFQFLHMMEIRCRHSTFTDCSWGCRSVTGLDLKRIQSPYINERIDGQTPLICGTVILLITSFWRRCRVPEPRFLRNKQLLLQLRQQRFQHQQECQRHAPWRCNMYYIYIYIYILYVYSLNTHSKSQSSVDSHK